MVEKSKVIGIMLQHSDGDKEYYEPELLKEDIEAIFKILEKYGDDNDSVRGDLKVINQEAKDLFSVGNMEFAIELQLANQHLGASREITRTLKNIGYEECKRMSEKEKQLLIAGIKQKLCGIGVIGVGVIFISSGMPVVFIALSAIGSTLCVSKENVVTICKNRLALLTNVNK